MLILGKFAFGGRNKKYLLTIIFILVFFAVPLFSQAADTTAPATSANNAFNYTPMEKIPGFETETVGNFYTYIQAVYKFGIWAVGISALLMISIGGFMYITSAGNNTAMEKAKGVITDAVIGLVLALTAYLLLYIINPDLVKIKPLPIIPAKAPTAQPPVGGPPLAPTPAKPPAGTFTCIGGNCSQIDNEIQNNASNVNSNILKSILVGGEGCNKSLSTDGFGSCGYSQALPTVRTQCGIQGTTAETCQKIQNDPQLDVNCAAWLIKHEEGRCTTTDILNVASCYNSGKPNNCANTTNNYCDRVSDYYSSCNK